MPGVVFDSAFLGSAGEDSTILVLLARDRRMQGIFAHLALRRGLAHEHGAKELEQDIRKLGYYEALLKCDGEPALMCVQEEVKPIRREPTTIDIYVVGSSQASWYKHWKGRPASSGTS